MTDYKVGQNVWYYDRGWYVGQYQRTVERGKRFGLLEIQVPGYEEKVYMEADNVSPIGYKGE